MSTDTEEPEVSEATEDDLQKQLDRMDRWAHDIVDAERACNEAELEWEGAKATAKERKTVYDRAVVRLRELIRKRDDPQRELPFPDDGDDPALTAPISELGMSDKETEAIEAASIETVGDLEQLMRDKPHDWWGDIKGFGQGKRDKLVEKWEAFRLEHPFRNESESDDETDNEDDGELPVHEAQQV